MKTRDDIESMIPQDGDTLTEYDVVVAGGGPAGIGAALASSMNGAETLLLEGRSFFGGVAQVALWMPVNQIMRKGVATTGKDGPQEFRARIVIDATGDGDVAYHAGAEMASGREEDGIHMPISLVFAVCNADEDRFFDYYSNSEEEFQAVTDQAEKEGYHTAAWYGFDRTTVPGAISVNNGALRGIGNLDGCKSQHLTLAERMGLLVAVDFIILARAKKIPGLEKCSLMRTGSAAGVRDTRRLVGEYVQTVEDARVGAEFEDIVARKYGAIDANQLFTGTMKSGFAYPYRSLLPKRIENLLMAGRCASATFMGHASGKSMGNMMGLGQAAGVAAALCCKRGVTPRKLDVKELQEKLKEMGVAL